MNDYHKKVQRYRKLFKNSLNRPIRVNYYRKKDFRHKLVGRVYKIRKSSLVLLQDDGLKVNIGFRNIRSVLHLSASMRIKASLYYNIHKYKPSPLNKSS